MGVSIFEIDGTTTNQHTEYFADPVYNDYAENCTVTIEEMTARWYCRSENTAHSFICEVAANCTVTAQSGVYMKKLLLYAICCLLLAASLLWVQSDTIPAVNLPLFYSGLGRADIKSCQLAASQPRGRKLTHFLPHRIPIVHELEKSDVMK